MEGTVGLIKVMNDTIEFLKNSLKESTELTMKLQQDLLAKDNECIDLKVKIDFLIQELSLKNDTK